MLAKMPGLGPRSAQRMALELLTKPDMLAELVRVMADAGTQIKQCADCGNLGVTERCHICCDDRRTGAVLCVVEGVDDVWALERSGVFKGKYYILGGVVSALAGVTPEMVGIPRLVARVRELGTEEVILALGASVDGQTTGHIITERLQTLDGVMVSSLAKGMPVGAEVDYLDEGTLRLALEGRRRVLGS